MASQAGLKLGDEIQPTHGIGGDGHKHDGFKVVGILKPTGTANDRAVFINIEGFYRLEGHALAEDTEHAEESKEHPAAHPAAGTVKQAAAHDHHDEAGHKDEHAHKEGEHDKETGHPHPGPLPKGEGEGQEEHAHEHKDGEHKDEPKTHAAEHAHDEKEHATEEAAGEKEHAAEHAGENHQEADRDPAEHAHEHPHPAGRTNIRITSITKKLGTLTPAVSQGEERGMRSTRTKNMGTTSTAIITGISTSRCRSTSAK